MYRIEKTLPKNQPKKPDTKRLEPSHSGDLGGRRQAIGHVREFDLAAGRQESWRQTNAKRTPSLGRSTGYVAGKKVTNGDVFSMKISDSEMVMKKNVRESILK